MVVDLLLDQFSIGIIDVFGRTITRMVGFRGIPTTVLVTLVVVPRGRLISGLTAVHWAEDLVLQRRGVDSDIGGDVCC